MTDIKENIPTQETEETVQEPDQQTEAENTAEEKTPEQAQIEALTQKCDEYLRMAQRSQADFENYKRRNEQTRASAYADGVGDMINAMLPVLDNFERALSVKSDAEGAKAVYDGVIMIQKQMIELLKQKGCEEIVTNVGDTFDPTYHNAVMTAQAPDEESSGKIAAVFQKGYKHHDKVLRYTMVSVFQ
ncbi:MAG: nucleotide exchange factor GrpE [Clostridia bacterium]|nr:nucleotide exchange factor GrpE [Clostridia bacterium]